MNTIYEQEGCRTKKDVCEWHRKQNMKIIEVPECLFSKSLIICLNGVLSNCNGNESTIRQSVREVLDFIELPNE